MIKMDLLKLMFPRVYGTTRSELIEGLEHEAFRPKENEELYSVFVYTAVVTPKTGHAINVRDVIVRGPNNEDASDLWNKDDFSLVYALSLHGYGADRPIHSTPYYAMLQNYWSIGMDAKEEGVLKIFPTDAKKQKCEINSAIIEFKFSFGQLMQLLKAKDCSDTVLRWAI